MADIFGFAGFDLSISPASSLFVFVVFWCSVTSLAVSESCKVLMLLQISLFSWVNRYLHCSIYALALADASFLTLFGVVTLYVFPMEVCWAGYSSCFCIIFVVFASFGHDRQMADGARDGWESLWTESQNLRHIEAECCVCVRVLRIFAKNSSPGVLLSAAFRTKSKGCKGQNARNNDSQVASPQPNKLQSGALE